MDLMVSGHAVDILAGFPLVFQYALVHMYFHYWIAVLNRSNDQ